jgi:hypothetical protein
MFWYAFKYIFWNINIGKYVSQFCKIELQVYEIKISIRIIVLSSWWRPNVYEYIFNFSY